MKTTGVYYSRLLARRPAESAKRGAVRRCRTGGSGSYRALQTLPAGADAVDGTACAADSRACRYIERAEKAPSLQTLARHVRLDNHHFHHCSAITGLTPKGYADAQRSQRLRNRPYAAETVSAAIFDAGYGANGRYYQQANAALGMAPKAYRTGGKGHAFISPSGAVRWARSWRRRAKWASAPFCWGPCAAAGPGSADKFPTPRS